MAASGVVESSVVASSVVESEAVVRGGAGSGAAESVLARPAEWGLVAGREVGSDVGSEIGSEVGEIGVLGGVGVLGGFGEIGRVGGELRVPAGGLPAHGPERERVLRKDLEGLLDEQELPAGAELLLRVEPDEFLEVQLAALDEVLTEFVMAAVEDLRERLEEAPRVRDLAEYLLGRPRHPEALFGPGCGVFGRVPSGGVHAAIDRLLRIGVLGVEGRTTRLCSISDSTWMMQAWGDERPRVLEALLGVPRRTPLYEALSDYRRQAAKEAEVPAYRILTNRVLHAIAEARPATLRDLSAISGVGPLTLSNHGETILSVVRSAPPDPITDDDN